MPRFREIKPADVLRAIEIINGPALAEFVSSLGFKEARTYRLVHRGLFYDSKQVVGIAHGVATGEYLDYDHVIGGEHGHAATVLERRGFFVDRGHLYDLELLRVDTTHGKPAHYQYLVFLWAIARARSHEPQLVPFTEVRQDLADVLQPFAIANTPPDPAMPWAALDRHPVLWQLVKPPGSTTVNDLDVKKLNIVGGLSDYVYGRAYEDDAFVAAAVEVIANLVGVDQDFVELMNHLRVSDLIGPPPTDSEGDIAEDSASPGLVAPSGHTTRMQDPEVRQKIERRAVEAALEYYAAIGGFNAQELGKPYDIMITLDGVERHYCGRSADEVGEMTC